MSNQEIALLKQPKFVADVTVIETPASAIVNAIRSSGGRLRFVVRQAPSIKNASSTPAKKVSKQFFFVFTTAAASTMLFFSLFVSMMHK